MTYDMNDRLIRVPAGSPGGETRAVAITGAGATVQDGTIEMTGADTIGTDVTADDATLRTVRYEYDDLGTRGIRARNIENFTVIDDTHTASGPAGTRLAYDYDGVRRVRVERSVPVWSAVVVTGSFVTECSFDEHEIRWVVFRDNLA